VYTTLAIKEAVAANDALMALSALDAVAA